MGKGKAISDEQIIAALLDHGTIRAAAGAVGISERALYDRMNKGEFQALYKAAKAFAYIYDREYVTPDDVKNVAVSVLSHRVILSPQGRSEFGTPEGYIAHILGTCPVPEMGS